MNQSEQNIELVRQVSAGHCSAVEKLLAAGASANARTPDFLSIPVLVVAIDRRDEPITRMLLEHGADVWASGELYRNALLAAMGTKSESLLDLVLQYATPIAETTKVPTSGFARHPASAEEKKQYMLCKALEDGLIESVEFLEKRGFARLDTERYGYRILHQAAHRRSWRTAAYAVVKGAKPFKSMWRIPAAAEFFLKVGLKNPFPPVAWDSFRYAPTPLSPTHPLWECHLSLNRMANSDLYAPVRAASQQELASIASLGGHQSLIEFYAHFMPVKGVGAMGSYSGFERLLRENLDEAPELHALGFFVLGSASDGDTLAFDRTPTGSRPTPRILRFSHEVPQSYWNRANALERAEVVAADIVEYIQQREHGVL